MDVNARPIYRLGTEIDRFPKHRFCLTEWDHTAFGPAPYAQFNLKSKSWEDAADPHAVTVRRDSGNFFRPGLLTRLFATLSAKREQGRYSRPPWRVTRYLQARLTLSGIRA